MTDLGTWAWAQHTNGTISQVDRAELSRRLGAVLEAAARPAPDTPLRHGVGDYSPPDSTLCREATGLWRDVAPDWLHGHGHRTWYYARALADIDHITADHELLYTACLLHDLGLTDHAVPDDTTPCFAVTGGRAATRLVEPHRGQRDAELVGEAIVMHLNIDIPPDAGGLHYLVAAGTLVDVAGTRLQLLPPRFVDELLHAHPRGDFGPRVGDELAQVGRAFPDTRCGYMHDTLDIAQLARRHPHG